MANAISRKSFTGFMALAASMAATSVAFATPGQAEHGDGSGSHGNVGRSASSNGAEGAAAYALADGDAIGGGASVAAKDDQSMFVASGDIAEPSRPLRGMR